MNMKSLLITSAFIIGLAMPAMAQQSMPRYAIFFKYNNQAVKAMTENPQDRSAQAVKLSESLGGKLEGIYWFATEGEFDGFAIGTVPNETAQQAQLMILRSTGNFARIESFLLMSAADLKAAMDKAKSTTTSYTPPTQTK